MNASETIGTQLTLPIELHQVISQRAQAHGQSINSEIVALLSLLVQDSAELAKELTAWEAASDEDWLSMETAMASQES